MIHVGRIYMGDGPGGSDPCGPQYAEWAGASLLGSNIPAPVDMTIKTVEGNNPGSFFQYANNSPQGQWCLCPDAWWVMTVDWSMLNSIFPALYAWGQSGTLTPTLFSQANNIKFSVSARLGPISWDFDAFYSYSAQWVAGPGNIWCESWSVNFHLYDRGSEVINYSFGDNDCVISNGEVGVPQPSYSPGLPSTLWARRQLTGTNATAATTTTNYGTDPFNSNVDIVPPCIGDAGLAGATGNFIFSSIGLTFADSGLAGFKATDMISYAGLYGGADYGSLGDLGPM